MLDIKVIGTDRANCDQLEQVTKHAVEYLGLEAQVIPINDYSRIMEYEIVSTPGLVINGKVVCSGRIPSMSEITTWLADAALENTKDE